MPTTFDQFQAKTIQLPKDRFALVDVEDYERLSISHWTFDGRYAARMDYAGGKPGKKIYLHQLILESKEGFDIDHINRDKLDNRRCNLRICSRVQNSRNKGLIKTNKSGINGVIWHKKSQKWMASITVSGHSKYLGIFIDIQDAAKARKIAEKVYWSLI